MFFDLSASRLACQAYWLDRESERRRPLYRARSCPAALRIAESKFVAAQYTFARPLSPASIARIHQSPDADKLSDWLEIELLTQLPAIWQDRFVPLSYHV